MCKANHEFGQVKDQYDQGGMGHVIISPWPLDLF